MANSIKTVGNLIHLSSLDSDWDYLTTFPGQNHGLLIYWIRMTLGQANDQIVLKWGSASGETFFDVKLPAALLAPVTLEFYGRRFKPYLDFSDCTVVGNPHLWICVK